MKSNVFFKDDCKYAPKVHSFEELKQNRKISSGSGESALHVVFFLLVVRNFTAAAMSRFQWKHLKIVLSACEDI